MGAVDIEEEVDDMRERLARIEVHQAHVVKQLDRVVLLLDRLVRVEEHVEEHRRSMARLFSRLEAAENELETWRSARRIIIWVGGVATAVVAAFAALASKSG